MHNNPREFKPDRVAALIHFSSDVEKERVLRWVKALEEKGFVDGYTVREYESAWGEPVWYIP